MRNLFKKLRCWLDYDELTDPLQDLSNQKNPPRKSEDFMSNVLRSLDATLQDEMFVPPKGEAQVPSKFIVFLNPTDDSNWQSQKRFALERNLSDLLLERAVELAGASSLCTPQIEVKIRVDQNLVSPMIQVVAFWDKEDSREDKPKYTEPETVASKVSENSFFQLSIFKNGQFEKEIPLFKRFVLIGRGTGSSEVDVLLEDREISRIQACLSISGNNRFRLTNYGGNSITVNKKTIQTNETVSLLPTDLILIRSFKLQINQPFFLPGVVPEATISSNPFETVHG